MRRQARPLRGQMRRAMLDAMPLRDDHEAAVARADALQVELERERAKERDQDAQVARLEAELAEARERLSRAEEALGKLRPRRAGESAPSRAPGAPPHRATPVGDGEASGAHDASGMPHARTTLLLAIGGAILLGLVVVALVRPKRARQAEAAARDADQLVAEGMERISPQEQLAALHVDHVGPDGVLDAAQGHVYILTQHRRSPDIIHLTSFCHAPSWTRDSGWTSGPESCVSLVEPRGAPGCTVAQILGRARSDAAPPGLATLAAHWDDSGGWRWRFAIRDEVRGVSFQRSYGDDCR